MLPRAVRKGSLTVSKGCLSSARVACACGVHVWRARVQKHCSIYTRIQIDPPQGMPRDSTSNEIERWTAVDSKLSRFPTLTKPFEPTTRCPELVQSCSAHRTYISPVTIGAINHARSTTLTCQFKKLVVFSKTTTRCRLGLSVSRAAAAGAQCARQLSADRTLMGERQFEALQ